MLVQAQGCRRHSLRKRCGLHVNLFILGSEGVVAPQPFSWASWLLCIAYAPIHCFLVSRSGASRLHLWFLVLSELPDKGRQVTGSLTLFGCCLAAGWVVGVAGAELRAL